MYNTASNLRKYLLPPQIEPMRAKMTMHRVQECHRVVLHVYHQKYPVFTIDIDWHQNICVLGKLYL